MREFVTIRTGVKEQQIELAARKRSRRRGRISLRRDRRYHRLADA
jgi:hypothetical protein